MVRLNILRLFRKKHEKQQEFVPPISIPKVVESDYVGHPVPLPSTRRANLSIDGEHFTSYPLKKSMWAPVTRYEGCKRAKD